MTLSLSDLALYAVAMFVLFMTPGPVWLALTARTLSGGFAAAWPLALGVTLGDALWPLLATLGISLLAAHVAGLLTVLRYVGALLFLVLGVQVLRHAGQGISSDSRLMRPGQWAGFLAGIAVILGNPKAILFYMGILPGFFDLSRVTATDVTAIVLISVCVPFLGNLAFAALVHRLRARLTSPVWMRRTTLFAGGLMILVGLIIPFT
ncbi:LysE family translocator [Pseudooceanicola sp. CBS1P-1]|uniref:LysE family transporter n=1 Tax=Pseudooceanicola albus TaxID=2692189 RepID=A0A6L7GB97_9RHOB|nr:MULTISPECIES: LysE family translocator [Pseudooceanicola]MBT9385831.1 LysE family translocator [Pseudooceanicola endophyticus]MXN20063.1 LysE family transporter [Pseudooceanicola albus]